MSPISLRAVVKHGIEHHNAHDVLVEVETQPVEFSRASVENKGVEVDLPHFDKLHDTVSKLGSGQLLHLSLDRHKEVTLEAGVGSSTKHISSSVLHPRIVAGVHVPWSVTLLLNVPMEVHTLHVDRDVVLLQVQLKVVAQAALPHGARDIILLHVLQRPGVEISLRDDALLQTALEVVLLQALHVSSVQALLLLLLPSSIAVQQRVGVDIMSISPLGHLGSAHCNSEIIKQDHS